MKTTFPPVPTKQIFLFCLLASLSLFSFAQSEQAFYHWAKSTGGTAVDRADALAFTPSGGVVICGNFSDSLHLDPEGTGLVLGSNGGDDAFVAAYSADGALEWAINIGDTSDEVANNITLDSDGNIYISGRFEDAADLDPGPDTLTFVASTFWDHFLMKLTPTGEMVWVYSFGDPSHEEVNEIHIGPDDYLYMFGNFRDSADFDLGPGTSMLYSPNDDLFLAKYDTAGTLQWANSFVGGGDQVPGSMYSDGGEGVYIAGRVTNVTDFDPGPGTANLSGGSTGDGFVAKYDSAGNYQWARSFGGPSYDLSYGITLDGFNNVYVANSFNDTLTFDTLPATTFLASNGGTDVALIKFGPAGELLWQKGIGGSGSDYCYSLAASDSGELYIATNFWSEVDLDPGPDSAIFYSSGNQDFALAKYDALGNYIWGASFGGFTQDDVLDIAFQAGEVAICGSFYTTGMDMDPSSNDDEIASTIFDGFIAKYSCSIFFEADTSGCEGDSLELYGLYPTATGSYFDTSAVGGGCDTVWKTNLTLFPTYFSGFSEEICEGDSFAFGGMSYGDAGVYYDSLSTMMGCDSVEALTLSASPIPNPGIGSSDTLCELDPGIDLFTLLSPDAETGGTWTDDDSSGGLTGSIVDPNTVGAGTYNFTYTLASSVCGDQSATVTLVVEVCASIWESFSSRPLSIYPNPNNGAFLIELPSRIPLESHIELFDLQGTRVHMQPSAGLETIEMNLQHLPAGIYFVKCSTENVMYTGRLMITGR